MGRRLFYHNSLLNRSKFPGPFCHPLAVRLGFFVLTELRYCPVKLSNSLTRAETSLRLEFVYAARICSLQAPFHNTWQYDARGIYRADFLQQMNSLRTVRFAHLPATIGFTWKWLALLAAVGALTGLALALIKSLPVS